MTRVPSSGSFRQRCLLLLGFLMLSACADNTPPSGPSPSGIAMAVGGGGGPRVRSTVPDSATIDTTLNVRVLGGGFDMGSRADWALKGVVTDKIVTNSTQFVSSSELVANITIARNAEVARYDVIVTTSTGKGGIGTELFLVTLKVTDLGTLGGLHSYAYNINSSGDITGQSEASDGSLRATYWARVSSNKWAIQQLGGSQGELHSRAGEINDAGAVLGWSIYPLSDGTMDQWAVRWVSSSATPESLPGLEGASVVASNLAGQFVGSMKVLGGKHGFRWENGIATDLGGLAGGDSWAADINNTGIIVGYGRLSLSLLRAVVWRTGVIAELPGLSSRSSNAIEVNDDGVIVGNSVNATPESRAVRWVPAAGEPSGYRIEDLGLSNSSAYDINNSGEIVGRYHGKDGLMHAFYWHPARGKMDLPTLRGQKGAQAYGINDSGEVVGYGWTGTGQSVAYHGMVWTGIR